MDFSHHGHRSILLSSLRQRLSRFQIRSPNSIATAQRVKLIRGFLLIFGSLVMAWISTQVNWQNNLLFFRNSEWPHPKAWTLSMQSLGFTAEPHLGDFSSSLRSHPEPYAEETGIWTNEEHSMVYVTHSPYQKEHEPELWNKSKLPRKNEKKSMHWILLGSGLNGIHRLMNDLEGMPSLAPSPHNIRKNIDPREIHY